MTVALDLSYSSPSSFTALFRKTLVVSPQTFIRMHAG